jgi:hypothetical protein
VCCVVALICFQLVEQRNDLGQLKLYFTIATYQT